MRKLVGRLGGAIAILLCLLLVWNEQVSEPKQGVRCDHQSGRDGSLAMRHHWTTLSQLALRVIGRSNVFGAILSNTEVVMHGFSDLFGGLDKLRVGVVDLVQAFVAQVISLLNVWSHEAIWFSKVGEDWLELGEALVGVLQGLLAVGGFLQRLKRVCNEGIRDEMLYEC